MRRKAASNLRVRMQDVALETGLSTATVSYVLNGQDVAIPSETRLRVQEAAERLGYRANRMAQQLARKDSGLVGVIIPSISDPFFSVLTSHLNTLTRERGYQLLFEVIDQQPDQKPALKAMDQLLGWNVAGLLLWMHRPIATADFERRLQGVPTVCMGIEDAFPHRADYIYLNHPVGTRAAVEQLITLGHQRFCYIDPFEPLPDPRRMTMLAVLHEAGLAPPYILEVTREEARAQVAEIARRPKAPTAFVCVNDTLALAALRGLHDANLCVPMDASVVACDASWVADFVEPTLSSVTFSLLEIAQQGVNLLHRAIAGESDSGPQRISVTPAYITRESVAAPPDFPG